MLLGPAGCTEDSLDPADSSSESSSSGSESSSGTEGGGLVVNACGTFDPNEPGDSIIPQDPDDPEIISACQALCEARAEIPECTLDVEACVDTCKMRSCDVCSNSLVPLLQCETMTFVADECTCDADGAQCPTSPDCDELVDATSACGG
ncbi:MAG: hypothetical protein AAGF11_13240 [Myxococcota bacterium]